MVGLKVPASCASQVNFVEVPVLANVHYASSQPESAINKYINSLQIRSPFKRR